MENPGVGITTSDVWIKTHTQEGDKILPCAQKYYDDLKQAQQEIKEKKDAGTPVDEVDTMIKAFGKDTRGWVRSVCAVSRTPYDYSSPARAKVAEMNKDGELKHQVKDLGYKMEVLLEGFGILGADLSRCWNGGICGSSKDLHHI